jgi:peptide/nickel transport system permease protein
MAKKEKVLKEVKQMQVSQTYWSLVWWRFKKSKTAIIGGIVLAILYFTMVLFPEFFSAYDKQTSSDKLKAPPQAPHFIDSEGKFHLRPFVYGYDQKLDLKLRTRTWIQNTDQLFPIYFFVEGVPYKLLGLIPWDRHLYGVGPQENYNKPDEYVFFLGTDSRGRDNLSLIIFGGRLSLMLGLIGQFLTIILGASLGTASGYYGGTTDVIVQRSTEYLAAFPSIPLFMALSAAIPKYWSQIAVYFMLTMLLALVNWGGLARQVRGLILSSREREYVLAAQSAGAGDSRLMFRHLMPSTMSHVIVIATLSIPGMILAETALSWLGLGLRPPAVSWGTLLQEAGTVEAIRNTPWMLSVVLFIIVTILAFNMLGDGLRDAMDPYGGR